ncbi:MAG: NAD(P)-dependent oxidoreductase [Actinobacteria bacterium]|nr:NAD(P)-dependent oxidoreductase [Actinomycetota bacterium]MBV8599265.1 NAD(P)-dependent oxidoreductase [Actinomycetota bacterium]
MMKVLVTGGAGYLGSVLAAQLLAEGHEVRVLDSLMHGGEPLLSLYPYEGFEFVRADVRSADAVDRALEGRDVVVHLAAIVGDPACKREPDLARAVNLEGSRTLFDRARGRVDRFVVASTCSNYGRMGDPSDYVDEESPLSPLSLYAETKVELELDLLGRNGDGPAVTVLRFATLYGLSPRMRLDLTVNEFTVELASTKALQVYGEQFWRPYIHVADAARAVRAVLDAPRETVAGEVFNAGTSEENYTKANLIDLLVARMDDDVTIDRVEVIEDPRDYRVSFGKIERTLGFRGLRTVPDGMDEILDAARAGLFDDRAASKYRN